MRLTVIVPSYKRPESLGRCLRALAAQRTRPDEVLVVLRPDDAAGREAAGAQPPPVRIVTVERPGVIAAMNAGLDASGGELVALTDDDAEPHPDWLERLSAAFARDPATAAVGGRDWIYKQGRLREGEQRVVGRIDRLGRTSGGHHIGVGPSRDVDILKGVNMCVRGDLLREVRFDERLRGVGTEHHWELALCLTLRRRGLRIVYDPAIGVDHMPQPRVDDSRQFDRAEVRDAVHNETLAVLEYLPRRRWPAHLAWAAAVGSGARPGLAHAVASPLLGRGSRWQEFRGAQQGVLLGLRAARGRGDRPPAVAPRASGAAQRT